MAVLLFSEMNEHSILVLYDLSLLPVYLLQQQRTGISSLHISTSEMN